MKTAPLLVAGLTAIAALGAGALLAAEDRALFEPRQARIASWVDEAADLMEQEPTGSGGLLPVAGEARASALERNRRAVRHPGARRSSAP